MEIIGRGFLAHSLAELMQAGPGAADAVVLAAGVSSTSVTDPGEFARERSLVEEVATRCAREARRLVVFSTASHAMYGHTDHPVRETDLLAPASAYGRHKLELEQTVAGSGASWLVLRLSHVVGPNQRPHHLLPAFVEQIRAGTMRLYRGAFRDLVDVRDVVASVTGLLAAGVCGEVVNVASGTPYPITAVAEGVRARMDRPVRVELVDTEPQRTVVSIERLRALLPEAAPAGGQRYLDHMLDRYVPGYRELEPSGTRDRAV
ncbi:MAG TPA: NAD-dependent epimerase/dehydratase family protein [Pseudonocardia sp.]|nr:NAD-dependent epimerase/dehydratase family protein [Pseudonocardia sp.]